MFRKGSLAERNPELAKQWHPTKNNDLTPYDVGSSMTIKVWWQCTLGHEWEANIQNRARLGVGCPYCANKKLWKGFNDLKTTNPLIAEEWHPTKNGNLSAENVVEGGRDSVWWLCKEGHEWEETLANRKARKTRCRLCPDEISVYSKLTLDGILVGIRFSINKHLVDYDIETLAFNGFTVDISDMREEKMYNMGDIFLTDLELSSRRTVHNGTSSLKDIRLLINLLRTQEIGLK